MTRRWGSLPALVIAALLVRGALYAFRGDYLDWDEALYLSMARNVLAGAGVTLNGLPHIALGPFVPVATAWLSRITGFELLTAQRALMALSGAALLVPLWYLLRLHAGERIARVGTVLAVGWPALIDVAPRLGPMWRHTYAGAEPPFLALLFGAVALGEAALRRAGPRRYGLCALAGICLALGYLARPEAVVFAGLYALVRVTPWFRTEPARRLGPALAVVAAACLVTAGPYLLHMHRLTGSWTPSGKLAPTRLTAGLYRDLVRDDREMGRYLRTWWALEDSHARLANPYWGVERSVPIDRRLAEYARAVEAERAPASPASRRAFRRLGRYLAVFWSLGAVIFAPFIILGVAWRDGRWVDRFPPFALAGLAASALTAWQVFALPRFFLYLVPALALWAGRGIVLAARLAERWGARNLDRPIAAALMAGGVLLAGARALGGEAASRRALGSEERLVAERLATVVAPGEPVISWHPRLAYWGGWDWRALPVARLDAVIHYAAARGVRYLFLSRGGYSPLSLVAPYVVLTVDPALADAYRRGGSSAGAHVHPATTLQPIAPIAGFPAGRLILSPPDTVEGNREP